MYTGDSPELFQRIAAALKEVLPPDTYTVNDLSTRALVSCAWFNDENCVCLLISSTDALNDDAWSRLQSYFVNVRVVFSDLIFLGCWDFAYSVLF